MREPINSQQRPVQQQGQPKGPKVKKREATDEEQQQYEAITKEALLMITEKPERFDAFMQAIEAGAPRATKAIAQIVVAMMDKAEQRVGQQIQNDDVLEGVAEALITEVYNIAVDEGILNKQVMNEDVFAATYFEFAKMWAKSHPERLDEADQKALQQQLAEEQAEADQRSAQQPQQQPQQRPQQPQPQPQQQPVQQQGGGLLAQAGGV